MKGGLKYHDSTTIYPQDINYQIPQTISQVQQEPNYTRPMYLKGQSGKKSLTKNKQKKSIVKDEIDCQTSNVRFSSKNSEFDNGLSNISTFSPCILVKGIPDKVSADFLRESFLYKGPVSKIQMGPGKGEAIVSFEKKYEIKSLLRRPFYLDAFTRLYLSEYSPDKKTLNKKDLRFDTNDIDEQPPKVAKLNRKLFLRKLPLDLTEDELYSHFSLFGKVISCKIILDKKTHKSRGYGFLIFQTADSANRVMEESEMIFLRGQLIQCDIADEKHQPLKKVRLSPVTDCSFMNNNEHSQEKSPQTSHSQAYQGINQYGERANESLTDKREKNRAKLKSELPPRLDSTKNDLKPLNHDLQGQELSGTWAGVSTDLLLNGNILKHQKESRIISSDQKKRKKKKGKNQKKSQRNLYGPSSLQVEFLEDIPQHFGEGGYGHLFQNFKDSSLVRIEETYYPSKIKNQKKERKVGKNISKKYDLNSLNYSFPRRQKIYEKNEQKEYIVNDQLDYQDISTFSSKEQLHQKAGKVKNPPSNRQNGKDRKMIQDADPVLLSSNFSIEPEIFTIFKKSGFSGLKIRIYPTLNLRSIPPLKQFEDHLGLKYDY